MTISDNGSRISQTKEDIRQRKVGLCCRMFFYANELIEEPESITREYKKYTLPYTACQLDILRKTIVGFLNECGGIIYIGISESSCRIRRVSGSRISEKQKEDILFQMRALCESIEPDVIANRLVTVKFVPVRDPANERYLPGQYVVKVVVEEGRSRELYTYRCKDGEALALRTENEVVRVDMNRQVRRVLGIMRDRLEGVRPRPVQLHYHPCPEPEVGEPVYRQ